MRRFAGFLDRMARSAFCRLFRSFCAKIPRDAGRLLRGHRDSPTQIAIYRRPCHAGARLDILQFLDQGLIRCNLSTHAPIKLSLAKPVGRRIPDEFAQSARGHPTGCKRLKQFGFAPIECAALRRRRQRLHPADGQFGIAERLEGFLLKFNRQTIGNGVGDGAQFPYAQIAGGEIDQGGKLNQIGGQITIERAFQRLDLTKLDILDDVELDGNVLGVRDIGRQLRRDLSGFIKGDFRTGQAVRCCRQILNFGFEVLNVWLHAPGAGQQRLRVGEQGLGRGLGQVVTVQGGFDFGDA